MKGFMQRLLCADVDLEGDDYSSALNPFLSIN